MCIHISNLTDPSNCTVMLQFCVNQSMQITTPLNTSNMYLGGKNYKHITFGKCLLPSVLGHLSSHVLFKNLQTKIYKTHKNYGLTKECSKLLQQRKQAKLQCLQSPSQMKRDNQNNT